MLIKRAILCSLLAMAVSSGQPAPFDTQKPGEGVFVFIPHERLDDVDGNSVLVVGGRSALIVDTNTSAAAASAVLGQVRKLTDKPVAFVVNTHWHYDHVLGNAVYKRAFPAVQIVAHEETARIGRTWAQFYPARAAKSLTATLESARQQLLTGKSAQGEALTPIEMRLTRAQVETAPVFEQKIREAEYVLPDITFRDAMTIDLGGRVVRLLNFGRGNTPGDAIVHVPDAGVIAAGDLVVHPTPYGLYSYPASWLGVMRRLNDMDGTIVPGHGPVMRDRKYVGVVIDLLESVVTQVRACVAQNLTLDETRKKVDLESFRRLLAGDDELKNWTFQTYWVTPIVERAWREARGEF